MVRVLCKEKNGKVFLSYDKEQWFGKITLQGK